jgi:hypothetical protein
LKNPKWFCSKCRKPFTRRWNANRHCNNKHSGNLHIISFTDYVIYRQDSNHLNNFNKENKGYQRNYEKNQVFFDTAISSNNLPFNSTDPLENYIDQELSPYELLSPLAPKYEELRRILDHLPEPSKNLLLGNALASAINSDNPVATMQKKVIEYRKSKSTIMMLNDLTKVYGGNKEFTKLLLKSKAKQKNRYH